MGKGKKKFFFEQFLIEMYDIGRWKAVLLMEEKQLNWLREILSPLNRITQVIVNYFRPHATRKKCRIQNCCKLVSSSPISTVAVHPQIKCNYCAELVKHIQ
jgi:hypothetical protein